MYLRAKYFAKYPQLAKIIVWSIKAAGEEKLQLALP